MILFLPRPLGVLLVLGVATMVAGRKLSSDARPASRVDVAATQPGQPAPATNPVVSVEGDLRGHFTVRPHVEGRVLTMLVDTGASVVALTAGDAEAIGLRPSPSEYRMGISTANGGVRAAPAYIRELRLGDILVRNVDAVVMPPGALGTSLLGMSFLRRLRGFDIAHGRLTLRG